MLVGTGGIQAIGCAFLVIGVDSVCYSGKKRCRVILMDWTEGTVQANFSWEGPDLHVTRLKEGVVPGGVPVPPYWPPNADKGHYFELITGLSIHT